MPTNNAWNSENPAQVAKGGTGIATTTAYAPICGGATATGALQAATTGLSSSGYVLTSNGNAALPSFQSPSGVGGVQLILSQIANNVASIVWTAGFNYKQYMLIIADSMPITNAASLYVALSTDGGASYINANYAAGSHYISFNTATWNNANSTTTIPLGGPQTSGTTGYSGTLFLTTISGSRPITSGHGYYYGSDVGYALDINGGVNATTSVVNAISIQYSSGNISSGTFTLYGLTN